MQDIKRVLVALDMTEMDEIIISYTSFLNSILNFDSVYFIHVSKSLMLPEEVMNKYADVLAPADESLKDLIEDKIEQHFEGNTDTAIEIREGNALDKILRWSKIKETDLIVVGKKDKLKGSGQLPNKLAKVGHCSILTVRETSKKSLDRIMVPIDFSSTSKYAFTKAAEMAELSQAELVVQNTYVVPTGFRKTGKTYSEFAEIMRQHSERATSNFLKEQNLTGLNCTTSLALDDDEEPSDKIYKDAESHDVNLLVIGSRGRTEIANILLGSVADKLLHHEGQIPVLVVKKKKENLGFLEALFRV